jgi:hypothetical protein
MPELIISISFPFLYPSLPSWELDAPIHPLFSTVSKLISPPCLSSPCTPTEPTHNLLGRLSHPRDTFVPGDIRSITVTPSA